jgi:hypothetical protein
MEISRLIPPQESAAAKFKSQDNADLFLRLQKNNTPKVCPTWSDCQPEVVSPSFGSSERAGLSHEANIN